jgi:preprotein translocase subunit SecB
VSAGGRGVVGSKKTKASVVAASSKVAKAASLEACSLIALHSQISRPPEEVVGDHKYNTKTHTVARALRERTVEVLVTLEISLQRAEGEQPWAVLSVTVRLLYEFPAELPSKEEIEGFARLNGTFNAWPYLREIVQSTTTRMGIPPLILPLYRIKAPVPKTSEKRSVRRS